MASKRTVRNWQRLAGKAYIRFGEWEWPDPYEPISCIVNDIYRKRIKRIFRSGEEIFIGTMTIREQIRNYIYFFETMVY